MKMTSLLIALALAACVKKIPTGARGLPDGAQCVGDRNSWGAWDCIADGQLYRCLQGRDSDEAACAKVTASYVMVKP